MAINFSRTILKERLKTDDLARHGLLMTGFAVLAGLLNYLYQLSMGIMLSPAEFATLFSLFSLFMIVLWIPRSLQLPMTKFVSALKARGNMSGVNYLWRFSLKGTLLLGLIAFAASAAASPLVSRLLNIDNNLFPLIMFLSFVFAFSVPVNLGVLQGLQRFLPLGFSQTLWALLRLSLAVLLVSLGLGVYGGLIPIVLAFGIVFLVTMYLLKGLSSFGNDRVELSALRSYTGFASLAFVCFAMLTNIDVVLAKHYLSSQSAEVYAGMSLLGRVALFAPMGIAVAMFPKTSELFERGGDHLSLLKKSALYVVLIGGAVVITYLLFPDFVRDFLLRGKYAFASPDLVKYGLAMLFFVLSFLLMSYFLSLNRSKKVALPLVGVAILQVVLIVLYHSSIAQLVNIMLVSGGLCLAFMLLLYWEVRNEQKQTRNR